MNIFILPIISSSLLVILFKMKLKQWHTLSILCVIVALSSSMVWAFIYSSFEDSLIISGIGYLFGWLLSLGLRAPKGQNQLEMIVLLNKIFFFATGTITLLAVLGNDIPGFGYYQDTIVSIFSLVVFIISAILAYKKYQKLNLTNR